MMLSSVDLPLPDGPSSTTTSPAEMLKIDAAQGTHLHLARGVDLGQRLAVKIVSDMALGAAFSHRAFGPFVRPDWPNRPSRGKNAGTSFA